MRTRMIAVTAALLLASATLAPAQGPTEPKQPAAGTWLGSIDFGGRFGSVNGDEARFERYRDLRNGANVNATLGKETEQFAFTATAYNIGYRDGSYAADFRNSRVKVAFSFDQLPLNYGYNTLSPWNVSANGANVLMTLDPAARAAAEARYASAIPNNAAAAASASIYRPLARGLEMQSRRDSLNLGVAIELTPGLEAEFGVRSHARTGSMPFGAAFAFNNANELPLPLDDRTTEFDAGLEWANTKGMVRVGWEGSWYSNQYQSLTWDNPLRATDYAANKTTLTGYDPSGYSNGNGPAQGRLATSPDSSANIISASGMAKLAKRTTVNGTVAFVSMKQNDAIIPWTINPVIANATVYAAFPGLAALPRATAEADVQAVNASFGLNSRPNKYVSFNARYRHNSHENRTPVWDASYNVRFDAVPEDVPGTHTEPYTITNNKFDAEAAFHLLPRTSFRVGYGYAGMEKSYLVFGKLTDNTLRASVDTVGSQYVTLRAQVERTQRTGDDFRLEALTGAGQQPGARLFDDAERTRNRATVLAILTPAAMVDFTVSYGMGKDDYDGTDHYFGLLSNDNTTFNVGMNVTPVPTVAFGANYGQEKFSSFQRSRNANPGPDPSWTDPNRDWTLDNEETVKSIDAYLDLLKALPKTDIRFGYLFSDSDNAFVHGGPRIAALAALKQFEALPNVTNTWHRGTIDLRYHLTQQVGLGASYWYEKFDVADFATVDLAPGQPRIDYLGGLTTGYGNRPYKVNTGFVRVFYVF